MSLRYHEDRNEETFQSIGLNIRTAVVVKKTMRTFSRQATRSTFEVTESKTTSKTQCARREPLAIGRTFADPQTGVAKGRTLSRNMRSICRCSMCPAIHINSRSWLRSSSTHEPSDPPPKVVTLGFLFRIHDVEARQERQVPSQPTSIFQQIKIVFAYGNKKTDRGRPPQEDRTLFEPSPQTPSRTARKDESPWHWRRLKLPLLKSRQTPRSLEDVTSHLSHAKED